MAKGKGRNQQRMAVRQLQRSNTAPSTPAKKSENATVQDKQDEVKKQKCVECQAILNALMPSIYEINRDGTKVTSLHEYDVLEVIFKDSPVLQNKMSFMKIKDVESSEKKSIDDRAYSVENDFVEKNHGNRGRISIARMIGYVVKDPEKPKSYQNVAMMSYISPPPSSVGGKAQANAIAYEKAKKDPIFCLTDPFAIVQSPAPYSSHSRQSKSDVTAVPTISPKILDVSYTKGISHYADDILLAQQKHHDIPPAASTGSYIVPSFARRSIIDVLLCIVECTREIIRALNIDPNLSREDMLDPEKVVSFRRPLKGNGEIDTSSPPGPNMFINFEQFCSADIEMAERRKRIKDLTLYMAEQYHNLKESFGNNDSVHASYKHALSERLPFDDALYGPLRSCAYTHNLDQDNLGNLRAIWNLMWRNLFPVVSSIELELAQEIKKCLYDELESAQKEREAQANNNAARFKPYINGETRLHLETSFERILSAQAEQSSKDKLQDVFTDKFFNFLGVLLSADGEHINKDVEQEFRQSIADIEEKHNQMPDLYTQDVVRRHILNVSAILDLARYIASSKAYRSKFNMTPEEVETEKNAELSFYHDKLTQNYKVSDIVAHAIHEMDSAEIQYIVRMLADSGKITQDTMFEITANMESKEEIADSREIS